MNKATFILSTGRCGTQWITHLIRDHFPNAIHVDHEAVKDIFLTRMLLGVPTDEPEMRSEIT